MYLLKLLLKIFFNFKVLHLKNLASEFDIVIKCFNFLLILLIAVLFTSSD